MKLTFDSATLLQQLSSAARVLSNKNSLPILDCYLMEVSEDGQTLAITASDTENTLNVTCPLVSFVPDMDAAKRRFCIKARTMMDALKEIPSQPLTLTINMQTMEVTGEYANGSFAIVADDPDEYPTPPSQSGETHTLSLRAKQMFSDIEGVFFALAEDEIRPVMTGVFFDLTPERMTVVSTDGRSLVRRTTPASPDVELPQQPSSFIMPKKTAAIFKGLLPKLDGTVKITFSDKQLMAETSSFRLTARLIDGRYPNYNSVIPQNNPYTATMATTNIMPALRRVLTFADQTSVLVRMTLSANGATLSSQDYNYNTSSKETVPAEWNGPSDFAIGVKGNLFLTVLQHLPSDINIKLADPSRALILQPVEPDEQTEILMLLMPMMLNE